MYKLKLTKIGNSVGVILPKEMLAQLKIEAGVSLFATESKDGVRLTPYDPSFERQMGAAERVMKARRMALREIAK